MVKNCIKLYATGVATADNVASSIIPVTGIISVISWSIIGTTSGVLGGIETLQLSSQSTGQFAVNDARNIIDECVAFCDSATTTMSFGTNKVTIIPGIKVSSGDKIYLHRQTTTSFTSLLVNVNIIIA